ncbi:acylphosphatase [Candidatus Scalindua japonica]|uniref:Acylphosphatase n=1 Tax=Candidatus Scalindua japonica TaxID=1284222 RepID=A0A286TUB5_9BACT|nr:acylphosphatase [Candidatus Scalindua japonica]GAX59441.1 acylphosphatase [Candidatus Scalindua japonica]
MEITRLHIVIEGIVQGVFFRASTKGESEKLGLTGWVKNCPDGRVEAVFEGDIDKIDRIIEWCKNGPPGAVVRNVETVWEQATGQYDTFSIRY